MDVKGGTLTVHCLRLGCETKERIHPIVLGLNAKQKSAYSRVPITVTVVVYVCVYSSSRPRWLKAYKIL